MAGITETKQFKITPDGKIELVVTDEVELLTLATRYLFTIRDDKETRTCRGIPAFAEILNADMAFLIYDTKPAKKNVVANALLMAQYPPDLAKMLYSLVPDICGDVIVIAYRDGELLPMEKVLHMLTPFIRLNKIVESSIRDLKE